MIASDSVIIVLAAGCSSRLGKPKQLLQYKGFTLIKHAVKIALQLQPLAVIVVSGFLHNELTDELANMPVEIVNNSNWKQGMGSSIIAGVNHIQHSNYRSKVDNITIMLSDQPLVTTAHLEKLITAVRSHNKQAVSATSYNNTIGVPASFSITFMPELLQLSPEKGAQVLFKKYKEELTAVQFDAAAIDIDTEADYFKLLTTDQDNI